MKENSKITEDDIKEKIRKKNMIGDYLTYPIMAVNFLKSDKKIKPLYYKYNNNKAQYILYFAPQIKENESSKKHVIIYIWRRMERREC